MNDYCSLVIDMLSQPHCVDMTEFMRRTIFLVYEYA